MTHIKARLASTSEALTRKPLLWTDIDELRRLDKEAAVWVARVQATRSQQHDDFMRTATNEQLVRQWCRTNLLFNSFEIEHTWVERYHMYPNFVLRSVFGGPQALVLFPELGPYPLWVIGARLLSVVTVSTRTLLVPLFLTAMSIVLVSPSGSFLSTNPMAWSIVEKLASALPYTGAVASFRGSCGHPGV